MCARPTQSVEVGGQQYPLPPSAKSGLNTARDHRPLPLSKATYLTLIFSFKWRWYLRARLSRWKGGQQGIPPATKLSQNTARGHRQRIYTIIFYLRHFHVSPRRKNGVRACARPRRGVGGRVETNTPPTPSAVMPRYDTPIFHVRPSIHPD